MKARKWKMWAVYDKENRLIIVRMFRDAYSLQGREKFRVEVRELPKRRKGGKR